MHIRTATRSTIDRLGKTMKRFVICFLCVSSTLAISSVADAQSLEDLRRLQMQRAAEARAIAAEMDAVMAAQVYLADRHSAYSTGRLLSNSQVQKDLELDQDQITELRKIQDDYQKQIRNEIKQARKNKSFNSKKWKEISQRIFKERKSAMGAVLLPHQSKRLKQIAAQMELKNRGDLNALIGSNLASELGIDDEQKERLKKRAAEIKKEFDEEVARLKKEAQQKLFRELRPDQRKKLDELTREKFEYKRDRRKK